MNTLSTSVCLHVNSFLDFYDLEKLCQTNKVNSIIVSTKSYAMYFGKQHLFGTKIEKQLLKNLLYTTTCTICDKITRVNSVHFRGKLNLMFCNDCELKHCSKCEQCALVRPKWFLQQAICGNRYSCLNRQVEHIKDGPVTCGDDSFCSVNNVYPYKDCEESLFNETGNDVIIKGNFYDTRTISTLVGWTTQHSHPVLDRMEDYDFDSCTFYDKLPFCSDPFAEASFLLEIYRGNHTPDQMIALAKTYTTDNVHKIISFVKLNSK